MKYLKGKSGKEIFDHYTKQGGTEMHKIVPLLPIALGDMEEVYSILEECQKLNQTLTIIYPGHGEKEGPNDKYVGEVNDGSIYLTSKT